VLGRAGRPPWGGSTGAAAAGTATGAAAATGAGSAAGIGGTARLGAGPDGGGADPAPASALAAAISAACALDRWACSSFGLGATIMKRRRPSIRGVDSTTATSLMSLMIRSSTFEPSSLCDISRPRNITVILALFDSLRNSRIFFSFTS
jgi:hypothetical protein